MSQTLAVSFRGNTIPYILSELLPFSVSLLSFVIIVFVIVSVLQNLYTDKPSSRCAKDNGLWSGIRSNEPKLRNSLHSGKKTCKIAYRGFITGNSKPIPQILQIPNLFLVQGCQAALIDLFTTNLIIIGGLMAVLVALELIGLCGAFYLRRFLLRSAR